MDREVYTLKVFSTRMEYDSFELGLTPHENEEANDYYGMNFNVTVWCRRQQCAKLWGKLYDENLVYATGMDILNVADPVGREEVALAEAFNGCQELCARTEEWQNIQGFSGYLQGLFVMPQFRRRGIGSYLLTHLEHILRHAMNIRIRAVGISPMPAAEPSSYKTLLTGLFVMMRTPCLRTWDTRASTSVWARRLSLPGLSASVIEEARSASLVSERLAQTPFAVCAALNVASSSPLAHASISSPHEESSRNLTTKRLISFSERNLPNASL